MQLGLEKTKLSPNQIDVGHVGNFVSDLFCGQAQLGGFFGHVDPELAYMPASRHEAACASGSMAILSAMTDLESGRYDLACVMGIEMMRNVSGDQAAEHLRAAAWSDKEWQNTPYLWPCAFDDLMTVYNQKFGLQTDHIRAISQKNYANAKLNPNAQSRAWEFAQSSFSNDDSNNPAVAGDIRRQDCGQMSDGAAVLFLATHQRAIDYKQVTQTAGDYRITNANKNTPANNMMTFNLGGSATTCASFIISKN